MNEGMQTGLATLAAGEALADDEVAALVRVIMTGQATDAQIGAFLMGIERVGVTAGAISGAVTAMREAVIPVRCERTPLIDTCGTGGSGISRRNVSTAVALAVAACGVGVAKHGNRGLSSRSGSADVLERLGVNISAPPAVVARCVDEVGVGFLFAPALHPAMRHAAGPRRELGFRTIFNLLGPLVNPAAVPRQTIGVFDPRRCVDMALALGALGSERVFVVHGVRAGEHASPEARPWIDDLSPDGETLVAEWHRGRLQLHTLRIEDAGLAPFPLSAIEGGDPADNAAALRALVDGAPGPYRTAVQYSGALALLAAGYEEFDALPRLAQEIGAVLESGAAGRVLDALVECSRGPIAATTSAAGEGGKHA
ncbi:MAG: anthranilate phosphoribosyltransferase [Nannocystaceae bacterium]|nr:anthranilate phosphoribosyltransferase [Myxococcales bacterium]